MNYRHQFHAGNFADVWKHALLLPIIRGLQRKEKGILFLDTHAGRGSYDLQAANRGDSLERKPEYPDGIGRLWAAERLEDSLVAYVALVKQFDRARGNIAGPLRFYPGSPWLARLSLRPQDRLALCELHEEEHAALAGELGRERKTSVHALDGYTAIRAMLPPPEKRALVLIDPPFEQKEEFTYIVSAIVDGLRRLPAATYAVWYPLTERARADQFLDDLLARALPPTFTAELAVAGDASPLKMRGCGLLVVNPPWQIEAELSPIVQDLAKRLAQAPGGSGHLRWLVREK